MKHANSLGDEERAARFVLNRHYYGVGRWGYKAGEFPTHKREDGFDVSREVFNNIVWAITLPGPRGQKGYKIHAIKYVVTAQRNDRTYTLTVWKCGQATNGKTERKDNPVEVCGGCYDRIHHRGSVRLSTGA